MVFSIAGILNQCNNAVLQWRPQTSNIDSVPSRFYSSGTWSEGTKTPLLLLHDTLMWWPKYSFQKNFNSNILNSPSSLV